MNENCSGHFESNGLYQKVLYTLLGKINLVRRLYICKKCNHNYYPLDEKLDIAKSCASKVLLKSLSLVSIFVPFEHALTFVKEFLGLNISKRFLQESVYKVGEAFSSYFQKEITTAERIELAGQNSPEAEVAYIQADGAHVPIKNEDVEDEVKKSSKSLKTKDKSNGYKENKLAIIFTNNDIVKKTTKSGKESIKITNKRFVTSLGKGVAHFRNALIKAYEINNVSHVKILVFLSDGADWLRKLQEEYFPHAIRILDWYHAVEHLWDVAKLLFGEKNKKEIALWVKPIKDFLWAGEVDTVLQMIKDTAESTKKDSTKLWELYNYYAKNKEAMRYATFREKGYFIGSGAIESANKYIVTSRMKLTGCRWTINHAENLIWVRIKYFEKKWNQFWDTMNLRNFLIGEISLADVS